MKSAPTLEPGELGLDRSGCLRAAAAGPFLVVAGPLLAVTRWWRVRRRGGDVRVTWRRAEADDTSGPELVALDLTVDAPLAAEARVRAALTDTTVRLAEALRRPDDVYHLVYRLPAADEAALAPVGPQLQELGERFDLALARRPLEWRTLLWLCLPRGQALAAAVDPLRADPEAPDEPAGLVAHVRPRWAVAVSFGRGRASAVFRAVLYLPPDAAPAAAHLLDRLAIALRGG